MPGMKRDCGGAAAILGAFKATVKQVSKIQLILPNLDQMSTCVGCAAQVLVAQWHNIATVP